MRQVGKKKKKKKKGIPQLPSRYTYFLISGTCKCYLLMQKSKYYLYVKDVIKLKILRGGVYPESQTFL